MNREPPCFTMTFHYPAPEILCTEFRPPTLEKKLVSNWFIGWFVKGSEPTTLLLHHLQEILTKVRAIWYYTYSKFSNEPKYVLICHAKWINSGRYYQTYLEMLFNVSKKKPWERFLSKPCLCRNHLHPVEKSPKFKSYWRWCWGKCKSNTDILSILQWLINPG